MRAFLFAHVDQLRRFLNSTKRRFNRRVRIAGEGDHSAIRARAGIDIEQRNAIDRFNRGSDLRE